MVLYAREGMSNEQVQAIVWPWFTHTPLTSYFGTRFAPHFLSSLSPHFTPRS